MLLRFSDDLDDALCITENVTREIFLLCLWAPPAGHGGAIGPWKTGAKALLVHRQNTIDFKIVGPYGSFSNDSVWKIFLLSNCLGSEVLRLIFLSGASMEKNYSHVLFEGA